MNEYYNLNLDEIDNAIESMYNAMALKNIEVLLWSGEGKNFNHMYKNYNYFDTLRDFDFESYNGVNESCLAVLFLDAIYNESYSEEEIYIDEDWDFYEKLYYNFRIPSQHRVYCEEDFDNFGQCYKILTLESEAIQEALRLCEKHDDRDSLRVISNLADSIPIKSSDLEEGASIDLNRYVVEILLTNYSMYELEYSQKELLELELYCRKVVDYYGKN